jgi:DNA excision repair protein ERCC-4
MQPPLIVDYRERLCGSIEKLMTQSRVEVREGELPCGDYLIGHFLIERKTVSDLFASLANGRLLRQLRAMRLSQGIVPLLIVEGGSSPECREVVPGALRNISLMVVARYQIPVLRTASIDDTVTRMLSLLKYARPAKSITLRSPEGRKPHDIEAQRLYVLSSLPHVGIERAKRLLERFVTLQAVFSASKEELMSVPGIGSVQALALVRVKGQS